MPRRIDHLVVHCSYTPPSMNIGAKEITRWHVDPPPKGNGWVAIGYHWVIRRDGSFEIGRGEDLKGAHVVNHNAHTIGICMVGGKLEGSGNPGKDETNFTHAQYDALEKLLFSLVDRYPGAKVRGHNDFTKDKTCPTFDVRAWAASRGLPV